MTMMLEMMARMIFISKIIATRKECQEAYLTFGDLNNPLQHRNIRVSNAPPTYTEVEVTTTGTPKNARHARIPQAIRQLMP
jgi:hypothetical protein